MIKNRFLMAAFAMASASGIELPSLSRGERRDRNPVPYRSSLSSPRESTEQELERDKAAIAKNQAKQARKAARRLAERSK